MSAVALVAYFVASQLPDAPLWLALVTRSLAWLLFPALLWWTGFLSAEERVKLRRLTRSLRGRLGWAGESAGEGVADAAPARKRILFVEQNCDGTIGGSHHSLLLLVKHLDRSRFEPIVAFYQHHALVPEFERWRGGGLASLEPVRALDSGAGLPLRKWSNSSRAVADVIGRKARMPTRCAPTSFI